ncbi:MAG: hypothetical protein JSV70_00650, partial [bacterium]
MPRIFSVKDIFFVATALFYLLALASQAVPQSLDSETLALKRTSQAFVRISRSVTPAVVNIKTYRRSTSRSYDLTDRLFGEMFEPFREFFG